MKKMKKITVAVTVELKGSIVIALIEFPEENIFWEFNACDLSQAAVITLKVQTHLEEALQIGFQQPEVYFRLLKKFNKKHNLDPSRIEVIWE